MRSRQRRFLAVGQEKRVEGRVPTVIMQGYLLNEDGYTVRVRRLSVPTDGGEEFGMVSIKGPRTVRGEQVAEEFAFDDVALAGQVLRRCRNKVLKRRYQLDGPVMVDVFDWDNEGLVVVETRDHEEALEPRVPGWVGREITGETLFNNEWLAKRPWKLWSRAEQEHWTASPNQRLPE